MRTLGLLTKSKEELDDENMDDASDLIQSASEDGFTFKPVNIFDVIRAISHFSSQAKGEDGILRSVVVKALRAIGNNLVRIINHSLRQGILPISRRKAQLITLKKTCTPLSPSDSVSSGRQNICIVS